MFGGQFGSPLLFGPLIDSTSVTIGTLVSATAATGMLLSLFLLREPDGRDNADRSNGTPVRNRR